MRVCRKKGGGKKLGEMFTFHLHEVFYSVVGHSAPVCFFFLTSISSSVTLTSWCFPSPSLFCLAESSEAPQEPVPTGSVDLSELLLEIRHLRLQLERSIQTNTALRERLEEQLLRGPNRSETININYLLSSPGKHMLTTCDKYTQACNTHTHKNLPGHVSVGFTFVLDEGGRSLGREGCDPLRHSFQSNNKYTSVLHGKKTSSEVT